MTKESDLPQASNPDPFGYMRLARGLEFLANEASAAGLEPASLRRARRFYLGSPTEFLDEALTAIEAILASRRELPPSIVGFAEGLASEIRRGFDSVGGA